MTRFWTDRIAISTALAGTVLMVFTIVWRINPVEGSVVPRFLTGTPVGLAVVWLLFVTCMPAWIAGVFFAHAIPMVSPYSDSGWRIACCLMFVTQFMLYFGLGRVGSLIVRAAKRRRTPRIEQRARQVSSEAAPSTASDEPSA